MNTPQYQCQSWYDGESKSVKDCTCGKCADAVSKPVEKTYSVPEQWLTELLRLSNALQKRLDSDSCDSELQAHILVGYISSVEAILKSYKNK